jgi:hypothetical protein
MKFAISDGLEQRQGAFFLALLHHLNSNQKTFLKGKQYNIGDF